MGFRGVITIIRQIQGNADAILAVLFWVTFFPIRAHAYTDPGTGLLIWQIVAAGAVGSLFFVRRLFKSLARIFRGRRENE